MKRYKTLILKGKDIKQIIGIKDALTVIEKTFKQFGQGKIKMPPKIYLTLEEYKGDFRAMPAYLAGFRACGIKWVNVHLDNSKKKLPTVMGIIVLNDCSTGFPLSIMDATYLTGLRTGAAGGIAAKYLANKNSNEISFVGCGAQARNQLLAINEIFKIKRMG